LACFTAIGNILWPFGIFCGHLVYLSPRFGILYLEKSGNPAYQPYQPKQSRFYETTLLEKFPKKWFYRIGSPDAFFRFANVKNNLVCKKRTLI
jgi:hypothetical protein